MSGGLRSWEVPLIAAEAKLQVVTQPQGKRAAIILEWFPMHTGNAPGIQLRQVVDTKAAALLARSIGKEVRQSIQNGVGVVEGHRHAAVNLELGPALTLRVILNEENCETIAHVLMEAVRYAEVERKLLRP